MITREKLIELAKVVAERQAYVDCLSVMNRPTDIGKRVDADANYKAAKYELWVAEFAYQNALTVYRPGDPTSPETASLPLRSGST